MEVDILFLYNKDEKFIGALSNKNSSMCPFFADNRYERLDNSASTIEFRTLLTHSSGIPSKIENEGYIAFEDHDGEFVQYKIIIAEEDRTSRQLYVLAVGSWIELTKEMVEPFENVKLSAKQQLDYLLRNTRWQSGQVVYNGVRTMSSDKMMTVLEATQRLRTAFRLEPRFRIEMGVNGEITGRYCDLLERRGIVHPNRFEIGKDVQLLRRKIDTAELVTALFGYGQQEEGANVDTPLDFSGVQWSKANGDPVNKPLGQKWVGSDEALAKYGGKDKKHRFGVHESTVQGDANSLLQHTWEVLQRRSIPKVTYEVDLAVLGDVGIGDTINIVDQKDDDNELYLEARVLEKEGPISEDKKGKAILGNYRELQKVDITETLQDQLRKYATKVQLQKEVETLNLAVATAKQAAIDEANNQIALSELEAKAYADGIVTAEEERAILDAQNKLAESKLYSDTKKQEAISQANTYTDQQALAIGEEIDEVESQLNATKTYIDGAFADGLVNEAEAKAIEKYLNSLSVEKADVDAKYTEIYNHTDLTNTTIKTDLQTKKTAYDTTHTNLINSINTAIADGKTTVEEKQDVDSKFASYRTALANLTSTFEKALTSISQKQADTAKTEAKNDVQGGIVPLPTGALNGNIYSSINNIVGGSEEVLVRNDGVLSVFVFNTGGAYYDWQFCGYWDETDKISRIANVRFFIPNNFKIELAEIRIESLPFPIYNTVGSLRRLCHPRALKLYKSQLIRNLKMIGYEFSEFFLYEGDSGGIDVTAETFGVDRWDPYPGDINDHTIKYVTGNLLGNINYGWNQLYLKTSIQPGIASNNSGFVKFTVVIKGYQK